MGSETTRQEILLAAGEVLATEGIEGFTTAAVAEAASVSQGLVHHYFDTKYNLLRELFAWGWERAQRDLSERVDTDDPRDRLVTFARYLLEADDHREERLSVARIDLEFRARSIHDEALRSVFEAGRNEMIEIVVEILEDGIDQGVFRPVDVESFAVVFVAAVIGAEQLFAIHGDDTVSEPILAGVTAIVDEHLLVEERGDARSTG